MRDGPVTGKRVSLGKVLAYAMLGAWALICLVPLYWLAVTSLKAEPDIVGGPNYIPFADFAPTLDAWAFILTHRTENLVRQYANSCLIALAATALTILIAALAIYSLTRFRWSPGRDRQLFLAMLATRILPPVAVVLPLYFMAAYTHTLDTRLALIATYSAVNLPVALWLLHPVLGAKASEQEEAAQLDGASHLQIFFSIALPMAKAGILAVTLLIFVLCWNEYLFAAYLAADHAMTLPPWIMGQLSMKEAQVGGDGEEWPRLSAALVLALIPVLACTSIVQRSLGRIGIDGGGVAR